MDGDKIVDCPLRLLRNLGEQAWKMNGMKVKQASIRAA